MRSSSVGDDADCMMAEVVGRPSGFGHEWAVEQAATRVSMVIPLTSVIASTAASAGSIAMVGVIGSRSRGWSRSVLCVGNYERRVTLVGAFSTVIAHLWRSVVAVRSSGGLATPGMMAILSGSVMVWTVLGPVLGVGFSRRPAKPRVTPVISSPAAERSARGPPICPTSEAIGLLHVLADLSRKLLARAGSFSDPPLEPERASKCKSLPRSWLLPGNALFLARPGGL